MIHLMLGLLMLLFKASGCSVFLITINIFRVVLKKRSDLLVQICGSVSSHKDKKLLKLTKN